MTREPHSQGKRDGGGGRVQLKNNKDVVEIVSGVPSTSQGYTTTLEFRTSSTYYSVASTRLLKISRGKTLMFADVRFREIFAIENKKESIHKPRSKMKITIVDSWC